MKKKRINKQGKEYLEERFLEIWNQYFPDLPKPKRQHRFHHKRLWRFDFAWPKYMVAVEIQGGSFMRRSRKGGRGGGHNSAIGQAKDYEKHREAAMLGWRLLPFNTHDLQEKLDKGKITKSGKRKRHRRFTIYTSVLLVGEFLEKEMSR